MKMHRFIGDFDVSAARLVIDEPTLVNQIVRVLKLRAGEKILLSNGRGVEATAALKAVHDRSVEVAVQTVMDNRNEPETKVVLYAAVLKKENFELVVEKAVETGAAEIVPIISRRTVKLGLKQDRLEKIAREAAEQSGRGVVPVVCKPVELYAALGEAAQLDAICFLDINATQSLHEYLKKTRPERVGIFIGPEGGWEQEECDMARSFQAELVSLGRRTLRAETAAIVSTYLAANHG